MTRRSARDSIFGWQTERHDGTMHVAIGNFAPESRS
jgi:hypothetical protein